MEVNYNTIIYEINSSLNQHLFLEFLGVASKFLYNRKAKLESDSWASRRDEVAVDDYSVLTKLALGEAHSPIPG